MNRYKYFLIYDRNKKIIYGECINWKCGEFDVVKLSDVTICLKKRFKARFIVTESRIDQLQKSHNKVKFLDEVSLDYEEEYKDFITKYSDEVIFNPLIDRCSNISMYVGCEMTSSNFQSWVEEHKNLLEEIKSKFDLDLLNRPELINSYVYYDPTRIAVNCRFIDKSEQSEERSPTKLKVTFYDEFNAYNKACYVITGHNEDGGLQTKEGMIPEKNIIIDFNESPDELEIKILNENSIIYSSRYGYIKSIKIRSKVIDGSVTLENGSDVSKYRELNMNIGKE